MTKKNGCNPGSIMHHGRCIKLKKGQIWQDTNRSRDNMYKILKINIKNKKTHGVFLDDAGWYGVDKKGVQHDNKIYERPVKKKTISFNKFEENMELMS